MPAGGVGCSPLPCLGLLFRPTHDDDGDDDFFDDNYGDSVGDDAYTRLFRPIITYKRQRWWGIEDADDDDGSDDGDVAVTKINVRELYTMINMVLFMVG